MSDLHLTDNPTLQDLQTYVADMVRERHFTDQVPQRFMLLLEECGEFARAAREHVGTKFAADTHHADMAEEAADVFIILLGICNLLGIDLEQAFRDKEEKNKQREWR
ncbi:MAG TPA: MazG nucleotide pyrophosphohydrolase domain-containing protein [Candidatus Saccharimonadales bacterium]|nr:MazG nucleotide pyrophosphohydrolase domain-containing protein [Candidatus Saccharimonadales bacterium]